MRSAMNASAAETPPPQYSAIGRAASRPAAVSSPRTSAASRNHGKADGRIEVWVGIDWLPTVDMAFLRDARSLADELGTGVHTHLSESISEVEGSLERFGMRPAHAYNQAGLLGPDVVAARSVCLDDSEIRLLAETGAHVSH